MADADKDDDDSSVMIVDKPEFTNPTASSKPSSSSQTSTKPKKTKSTLSGNDDDEIEVVETENSIFNPTISYPHPRHLCGVNNFKTTSHKLTCDKCYCYVCNIPAKDCREWKVHCDANDEEYKWETMRNKKKSEAADVIVLDDSDDEEESSEAAEVKKVLTEVYDEIQTVQKPGSTAIEGECSQLPTLPGLHIDTIGRIPFPLTNVYADFLIQKVTKPLNMNNNSSSTSTSSSSSSSQSGSRNNTILQIDKPFKFDNPAWDKSLKSVFKEVSEKHGLDHDSTSYKMDKLILHTPSSTSDGDSTDTTFSYTEQKKSNQNMIGVLYIQFPSEFSGAQAAVVQSQSSNNNSPSTRSQSNNNIEEDYILDLHKNSEFSCKYISHYVDFTCNMNKLEQGHRLYLTYVLEYNKTDGNVPSSQNIGNRALGEALLKLPDKQFLFGIPLVEKYENLANTKSLRGIDMERKNAIEALSKKKGDWKVVFIRIQKEEDDRSPYYESIYDDVGSCYSRYACWIRPNLKTDPVEEGGMVLMAKGQSANSMWVKKNRARDPWDYDPYSRDQYKASLLVVFNRETMFSCLCRSSFSSALGELQRDKGLLPEVLSYVKKNEPSLMFSDFKDLLKIAEPEMEDDPTRIQEFLEITFPCLKKRWRTYEDGIPSGFDNDSRQKLRELLDKHGDAALKPMKTLMDGLSDMWNGFSPSQFIKKMKFYLELAKGKYETEFSSIIEKAIQAFEEKTASHDYELSEYRPIASTLSDAMDEATRLARVLGASKVLRIVQASIHRCRKSRGGNLSFINTCIETIERFSREFRPCDSTPLQDDIAEDYINYLKTSVPNSTTGLYDNDESTYLTRGNHLSLVKWIVISAKEKHMERLVKWSSKASYESIKTKLDFFSKVDTTGNKKSEKFVEDCTKSFMGYVYEALLKQIEAVPGGYHAREAIRDQVKLKKFVEFLFEDGKQDHLNRFLSKTSEMGLHLLMSVHTAFTKTQVQGSISSGDSSEKDSKRSDIIKTLNKQIIKQFVTEIKGIRTKNVLHHTISLNPGILEVFSSNATKAEFDSLQAWVTSSNSIHSSIDMLNEFQKVFFRMECADPARSVFKNNLLHTIEQQIMKLFFTKIETTKDDKYLDSFLQNAYLCNLSLRAIFSAQESTHIDRLQKWASSANRKITSLGLIRRHCTAIRFTDNAKMTRMTSFLQGFQLQELKATINGQQAELNGLLKSKEQSSYAFKWNLEVGSNNLVPSSGNYEVDEFLRSDKKGPSRITCGGGIAYARRLVKLYSGLRYSGCYTITDPMGRGASAYVTVLKNKSLIETALKQQKQRDLEKIPTLQKSIVDLTAQLKKLESEKNNSNSDTNKREAVAQNINGNTDAHPNKRLKS